jgi:hypothetical protein
MSLQIDTSTNAIPIRLEHPQAQFSFRAENATGPSWLDQYETITGTSSPKDTFQPNTAYSII